MDLVRGGLRDAPLQCPHRGQLRRVDPAVRGLPRQAAPGRMGAGDVPVPEVAGGRRARCGIDPELRCWARSCSCTATCSRSTCPGCDHRESNAPTVAASSRRCYPVGATSLHTVHWHGLVREPSTRGQIVDWFRARSCPRRGLEQPTQRADQWL